MLIYVPAVYAAPSLPLGRYFLIIIENEREVAEVDLFRTSSICAPRPWPPIASRLRAMIRLYRAGHGSCSVIGPPTMWRWCPIHPRCSPAAPIRSRSAMPPQPWKARPTNSLGCCAQPPWSACTISVQPARRVTLEDDRCLAGANRVRFIFHSIGAKLDRIGRTDLGAACLESIANGSPL